MSRSKTSFCWSRLPLPQSPAHVSRLLSQKLTFSAIALQTAPQAPSQAFSPAAIAEQIDVRSLNMYMYISKLSAPAAISTASAAIGLANATLMPSVPKPASVPFQQKINPSALAAARIGPSQPQSHPSLQSAPPMLYKDLVKEHQVRIRAQCEA